MVSVVQPFLMSPRWSTRLLVGVLLVGLAVQPSAAWVLPGATAGNAPSFPRNANYVTGNLTSRGGALGISWAPNPTTDDVGGPAPPSTDVLQPANSLLLQNAGQPAHYPLPADDVFESEPLPFDVHLNASRAIFVNLTLWGFGDNTWGWAYDPCVNYESATTAGALWPSDFGPDPDLGIRLYAGATLVGGQDHESYASNKGGAYADGTAVCHFRFVPEVGLFPAGTVLKLHVVHHGESKHVQYALGPDHRSQVFLPVYSAFELFFRDPALAGEDPSGLGGTITVGGSASSAAGVPWAGVACVLGLGRGRRRILVGLVTTSLLLAGCTNHEETRAAGDDLDEPGSHATSTIRQGDLGLTEAGKGAVLGQVHDDLHVPLARAHVSLVGSPLFTESDSSGYFALKAVPPGKYTLRIDATDYRSLEAPMEVVENGVTRVDATLLPAKLREADYRPHHHDYWDGTDTKTVLDGSLGLSDGQPNYQFTLPAQAPGYTGTNPNTILPGTYAIDVSLTWSATAFGVDRFGLDFSPADSSLFYTLLPRESGAAFHIVGTWESDDVGHQQFSNWDFKVYLPREEDPGDANTVNEELSPPPTVQAKIVVHKGVLPLEPAHPDHWGGAMSLKVFERKTGFTPTYWTANWAVEDAFAGGCLTNAYQDWAAAFSTNLGSPARPVPQGTLWLEVTLKQSRASGGAGDLGKFGWSLLFKPGNLPPASHNFVTGTPGFQTAPAATVSPDGLTTTWKFKVKAEEADDIYNKKSVWWFAVTPDDVEAACQDAHLHAGASASLVMAPFQVTAHRDVGP